MNEDMIVGAGIALLAQAGKGVLGEVQKTSGDLVRYLLGNRVSEWQTTNLINMAGKTAEKFRERGIDISQAKALPNSELYALFQGASVTDDGDLLEMWSELLASGMAPDTEEGAPIALSSVLSSMDGNDARLFHAFVKASDALLELSRFQNELDKVHRRDFPSYGPRDEEKTKRSHDSSAQNRKILDEKLVEISRDFGEAVSPQNIGFEHSKANLCRLGLIRKDFSAQLREASWIQETIGARDLHTWATHEIRKLKEKISKLHLQTLPTVLASSSEPETGPLVSFQIQVPAKYRLTHLGNRLASACNLRAK